MAGKQVKNAHVANRFCTMFLQEGGIAAWVISVKPNSFTNLLALFLLLQADFYRACSAAEEIRERLPLRADEAASLCLGPKKLFAQEGNDREICRIAFAVSKELGISSLQDI